MVISKMVISTMVIRTMSVIRVSELRTTGYKCSLEKELDEQANTPSVGGGTQFNRRIAALVWILTSPKVAQC